MISNEQIAADLMVYLKENPDACADVSISVGNMPWVRYRDGEWQFAQFGENGRVNAKIRSEEATKEIFASNPVTIEPTSEAYQWKPATETVWEHADEQDAFTDADRCFWCGHSERTSNLSCYETTEDGECRLCDECFETWDRQEQIVSEVRLA